MGKLDPPTTHGVFKPVGYALIAFRAPDVLQAAMKALGTAVGVFLLAHAPSEQSVATVIAIQQAVSAQHYGRLLIRDLTEPSPGAP
jgi:hypothetical protein